MNKMKKMLGMICILLLLCSTAQAETVIVTTFYPMYIFTQNVTAGVQDVRVANMADQSVGCLHDYQLQTRDMVTLEEADVLVINGGGMEQFMDKVISLRDDLPVIDACEGIDLVESGEHEHEDGEVHAQDEQIVYNAHVWLNPQMAVQQVKNIAAGLAKADPENAQAYLDNGENYAARLTALDETLQVQLAPIAGSEIITFHEAFTYFADAYDLHVAGEIATEPGEEPSTRDIAQTCDLVRNLNISTLFVEPQYPQKAAETIARETGAAIYVLDPVVSGDGSPESYETAMRSNAAVLTEALE